MKPARLTSALLLIALAAPQTALACREVVTTMGKGLATQAYIAPDPANVLILYSDESLDRQYEGLSLAGHSLTVVTSLDEVSNALGGNDYNIVIAPLDRIDDVNQLVAAEASVRVVPVVSRDMRRSREVRDRFDQYLVENAGVSKFLVVINRAMAS